MKHQTVRLATAAALVAALGACGEPAAPQAPAVQSPSAALQPSVSASPAQASMSPATVPQSLRFTATTVDGKPFDAAALAGKPVVLWFWAAWCPRCRAKAADVVAVQRAHGDAVHVVGVAGLGSGKDAMRRFAADTGITAFANLDDDRGEVWRRFDVTAQEYFVVIDRDGKVVHRGGLSGDQLRERVAALAG
ncbi:hypothetical protein CS0771_46400 [Catellatospora sp. IY07-71]|uniref:TlpA family protein disulfide reductase n=1 Tax=Catellatospora sp. IY07-71 TaxID=2728827 RepID=UPI001BB366AD|nr:TlpA disulfide reductase family protein [Catellatospora sp. IY07-71]BCJ75096.1 hypothetical protein CS0771_46400 [Catellatospora sp. IY07-71]